MKLIPRGAGTYNKAGTEYVRHDITVPKEALRLLGWTANDELKWTVRSGRLIIERIDD